MQLNAYSWNDIKDVYDVTGLDIVVHGKIECERTLQWTNNAALAPVEIKGANENAELTWPANSGPWENGLRLMGNDFVVHNLKVSGCREAGIRFLGQHLEVYACDIYENGVGVWCEGNTFAVHSNNIHDGIMTVADSAWNNDFGAIAIKVKKGSGEVYENTIYNMLAPSPDYGKDGSGIEFYPDAGPIGVVSIHDNVFYNVNTLMEAGVTNRQNGIGAVDVFDNTLYVDQSSDWTNFQFYTIHLDGHFGVPITGEGYKFRNNRLYNIWETSRFVSRAPEAGEITLEDNIEHIIGSKTLDEFLTFIGDISDDPAPLPEPEFINVIAYPFGWKWLPIILSINKNELK